MNVLLINAINYRPTLSHLSREIYSYLIVKLNTNSLMFAIMKFIIYHMIELFSDNN
jgi:hypothetical protein